MYSPVPWGWRRSYIPPVPWGWRRSYIHLFPEDGESHIFTGSLRLEKVIYSQVLWGWRGHISHLFSAAGEVIHISHLFSEAGEVIYPALRVFGHTLDWWHQAGLLGQEPRIMGPPVWICSGFNRYSHWHGQGSVLPKAVLRIRIRRIRNISLDPNPYQMIQIRIQQKPLKTENKIIF